MRCGIDACWQSIILAVLAALSLCLLIYLGIFLYVVYLTDRLYSIDLKYWRQVQLNRIAERYAEQLRQINQQIRSLSPPPTAPPKRK